MTKQPNNDLNSKWWNNNPMTYVESDIDKWSDKARWAREREEFLRLNTQYLDTNPWLQDFFAQAKSKQNLHGKRVLDIGTGWGSSSILLESLGANVTAIDLSTTSIDGAKKNHTFFGHGTVKILQMDAEKLDFDDASFDYVFSWGVIHHSHCTENAVSEIRRILKPGGQGMVMVYNRLSTRYYLLGLWYLILKGKAFSGHTFKSVQRFFTDGHYHRHFTTSEFETLLSNSGLRPVKSELSYMARRMIPGMRDGSKADNWLKKRFGWLLITQFVAE